jgi:hypothetical protein
MHQFVLRPLVLEPARRPTQRNLVLYQLRHADGACTCKRDPIRKAIHLRAELLPNGGGVAGPESRRAI